jgi:stage II sporulation protein D
VAIRTYLVSKIRESKASSELYHIKSTKEHQTYLGHDFMVRDSALIQRAVDETRGEFLTYNGKPIVAMYDSCCGGDIPSKMEGIDFAGHPYLARSYPCTYCKRCKAYRWEVKHSVEKWAEIFRKEFPKLGRIRSIKVVRRDAAGFVKEIAIADNKHVYSMSGKKIYALGGGIRSCRFSVYKDGNNIGLHGKGNGHGVGLCQWGAYEMVQPDAADKRNAAGKSNAAGKPKHNYREVLFFYYPGVAFAHLN